MMVTPLTPCVLRNALSALPFNNKNNHFGRFHLHKEDKIMYSMLHACTIILEYIALMGLRVK